MSTRVRRLAIITGALTIAAGLNGCVGSGSQAEHAQGRESDTVATPSPVPGALATDPDSLGAIAVFEDFAQAYFDLARDGYRANQLPSRLVELTVEPERSRLGDELILLQSTGMHVGKGRPRLAWVRALGLRGSPLDKAVTVQACVDNTGLEFASPKPSAPPAFVTYDAVVRQDTDLRWKVAHLEFAWGAAC